MVAFAGSIDAARAPWRSWRKSSLVVAGFETDVALGSSNATVSFLARGFEITRVEISAALGSLANEVFAGESGLALGAGLARTEDAALGVLASSCLAFPTTRTILIGGADFSFREGIDGAERVDVVGLGAVVVVAIILGLEVHDSAAIRTMGKAEDMADLVVSDFCKIHLVLFDIVGGKTPRDEWTEEDGPTAQGSRATGTRRCKGECARTGSQGRPDRSLGKINDDFATGLASCHRGTGGERRYKRVGSTHPMLF